MGRKKNKKNKMIIVYFIVLIIWLILFFYCIITNYQKVHVYDNKIFYNTFIDNEDISKVDVNKLGKKINIYSSKKLSKKVNLKINNKNYYYTYSELGINTNKDKVKKEILEYNNNLNSVDKFFRLNKKEKQEFKLEYTYNVENIRESLLKIKKSVDTNLVNGYFSKDDARNIKYIEGIDGFSLDVEKSLKEITDNISKNEEITLIGDTVKAESNESYKSIDTKVSSFSTEFNPYISRATNLKTGLSYIDGVIINPQEVFSFYKYAGPYNKKGYVFYYEFVGNGVCQIATTVYNTALLGGLEIVKRYPHAKKSVYVPGGLDATVASYASGWNVDFQFKNTYKYPIYISAYAVNGTAHVDFWSNHDAMEGKTYTTESVKLGNRYYQTFLHTFKDGVEIKKEEIAKTWYTED